MEYINNEIIKKYISDVDIQSGGNINKKLNILNKWVDFFNLDEVSKLKYDIEQDTEHLNELIKKYSGYKKLDKNKLKEIVKDLNSQIVGKTSNNKLFDYGIQKNDIGLNLSVYQKKLQKLINSQINQDKIQDLKVDFDGNDYSQVIEILSNRMNKLIQLNSKLDLYILKLDNLGNLEYSFVLDPKNMSSRNFLDSINYIDVISGKSYEKDSRFIFSEDDVAKKSEVMTQILTLKNIRNDFKIISNLESFSDEIYKIISPLNISENITFLDNESLSFLNKKLEDSKKLRLDMNLKVQDIDDIKYKVIEIEKSKDDILNERKSIEKSLIKISDLKFNFSDKIPENNTKLKNLKLINIFLKKFIKNKIFEKEDYYQIVLNILQIEYDKSKYDYDKIINNEINLTVKMLKFSENKIFKNYLDFLLDSYLNNEKKINRINEIKVYLSSGDQLKKDLNKIKLEMEDIKLKLSQKNADVKSYLQEKDINWIQMGGSIQILTEKMLDYDNLVNEVNIKYMNIKSKLNRLEFYYKDLLKRNNNINFIKLVVLLSVKYQETNKVISYKVLTKKNMSEIFNYLNEIKIYKQKNVGSKISIYLNNYVFLLDLLEEMLVKLISILDEKKGLNVLESKNPSKRYFDFININLDLVKKLYLLTK